MTTAIAFALAGLGGFNAHGAGVLAAASKCEVVPDLITATSGQIIVLADWLQGNDLEKSLVLPEFSRNSLAPLTVLLSGDPGVFRPAYPEMIKRWLSLPSSNENPVEALLDRLLPAQLYVPTRPQAFFSDTANVFNAAKVAGREVGVVFNAYNLRTGQGVLFGNDKARSLWPKKRANPSATKSVAFLGETGSDEIELRPITAEAVRSSLWLSLYGFNKHPQPDLIDGAYARSWIISELHAFDRIFVARPLARGWLGKGGPRNWFEIQDWQTEMWFSASYKAEVDALNQINGLVADGKLGAPYKNVELIEIAPETPAGFFNYFVERETVYKRAYDQAIDKFKSFGARFTGSSN